MPTGVIADRHAHKFFTDLREISTSHPRRSSACRRHSRLPGEGEPRVRGPGARCAGRPLAVASTPGRPALRHDFEEVTLRVRVVLERVEGDAAGVTLASHGPFHLRRTSRARPGHPPPERGACREHDGAAGAIVSRAAEDGPAGGTKYELVKRLLHDQDFPFAMAAEVLAPGAGAPRQAARGRRDACVVARRRPRGTRPHRARVVACAGRGGRARQRGGRRAARARRALGQPKQLRTRGESLSSSSRCALTGRGGRRRATRRQEAKSGVTSTRARSPVRQPWLAPQRRALGRVRCHCHNAGLPAGPGTSES